MIVFLLPLLSLSDPSRSATPYPTSKSGVPSPLAAFLTCGIGLLIIFLIVVVLCIKKSTDNEAFGSTQALLVTADV
ncbi:hypothetical protein M9Y10_045123 [Tritrichomonas musculus]|uniref:Uncharacterized protein n=1 Tax=Tritrichomonas musculus TaxID=1915356 RepID=A0ABR2JUQ3_9EUKA